MSLDKNDPKYGMLQNRLNGLRSRITSKREQAREMFSDILKSLKTERGNELPEELKDQLEQIRSTLHLSSLSAEDEAKIQNIDSKYEDFTVEDLLKAIQSLTTTPGEKSKLQATVLKEELKKMIMARFAQEGRTDIANWKQSVNAIDFVSLLESSKYRETVESFGGALSVIDKSIDLADDFSSIFKQMNDIRNKTSSTKQTPPPAMTEKERGF